MHSYKSGLRSYAILGLALLVTIAWAGVACGQNSVNSASVAKPVLPESADAAKTGQPAAPDTVPQRVVDVRPEGFVIGVEDILNVNVWKEPEMSRIVPVRPDGMITLPLIGEIQAKGMTPVQLQDQITASLKKFMSDPQVTVIVAEVHSLTFNVVGLVLKPGYYPLTRRMTVLDAIALSGGFQPFAKQKKVYILRTQADGKQVRIPFNYKDVIKGKRPDENIELQPRDTVVIP
jgi:polysaccharide biosynthesis/export protein